MAEESPKAQEYHAVMPQLAQRVDDNAFHLGQPRPSRWRINSK
jgi:hypothetical protein